MTADRAASLGFERTLRRLLRAARGRLLLHALLSLLAAAGGAGLLAAAALGTLAAPSMWLKSGLLLAWLGIAAAVLHARLALPWRRVRDAAALSRALESGGGLDNLLVAAEEALRRPDRWGADPAVPPVLLASLFASAQQRAAGIVPGRRLPLSGAGATLLLVLAAGVFLAGTEARHPGRLALGWERLWHPLRTEGLAAEIGLYLAPGPAAVVAGEEAVLAALDFGAGGSAVTAELRSGTGLWRAAPAPPLPAGREGAATRWELRMPDTRETFSYRFRRDRIVTPARTVQVLHPPLLVSWAGRLEPPAYTGLPAQDMSQLPALLTAPAGSRLRWRGSVNHPVVHAAVVTAAGDTLPLARHEHELSGEIVLRQPLAYQVALRDRHGLAGGSRVRYEVAVTPDANPTARLERPDDDGRLPGDARIELAADAADDHGLTRLDLLLWRQRTAPTAADPADSLESWPRLTVWSAGERPGAAAPFRTGETPWGSLSVTVAADGAAAGGMGAADRQVALRLHVDAAGVELVPGDALLLCLEARDNRAPGPAGRGRSRVLRLVLPSAAEILAAQTEAGRERVDELDRMRARGRDLTADLQRLGRELRKNPLPDWSRRQEIEAALQRQQALRDELEELARGLQQDLERLDENRLLSHELLEKMEEVSDLLRQVANPELENLLAMLQQAAAELSPEQLRQAVEEVARNQEELARRLDRAISLLKEMSRLQEMEGMTAVLERLLREQQALLEAQREPAAAPEDPAELAARQEALAEEAQRLQEQLREAQERLAGEQAEQAERQSPSAEQMARSLEEALRRLAEQSPAEKMREAARRLREQSEGAPPSAQPPQEQALRDLAALYHVLLQGQQGMQMAMQQHLATSLRRLAGELLDISAQQEEVAQLVPADLRGVHAAELTRRQNRLLRAARAVRDRLDEVGGRSTAVPARLLRDLDGVVQQLGVTVRGLEQGWGTAARRDARSSLAAINRVVIGLLTAAEQMGQGGGGGSPLPSAQRLQQMAREQAGLNGLAEQLRRQMQGRGLSQETRAQMQRLQGDQSGLAGQARDLEREQARRGERLLGDLEELAREMERVSDDLGQGLVDDELLRRQERILGRLLDAHNSVRERDYDQRRESRTARRLFDDAGAGRVSPGAQGEGDARRQRREPVEKAPPEYHELVRRYFQALDRLSPPGGGTP